MIKKTNIKVLMDKTLHHVPKILTTKLIRHRSVKGTKVVQRETLETFNYRRGFYTTAAIVLLVSIGIGYGVFAAMNIGMTSEEVKANLMKQFNNNNEVADILDRKGVDSLTYIFDKGLDNNKVYTFTDTSDKKLEHDVTSNVYHVKDIVPANVPTTVKRAYSKEDVEGNYIKSIGGVELNGLETGRERNPNTYILKSNFNEQTVYAFSGTKTKTQEHQVTSNVYHVEDNLPEFVPSSVQRAYSKQDIENNYIKRLKGNVLLGLETKVEVDPNTYMLRSNFKASQIYTINGIATNKELVDSTNSILYKHNNRGVNLPTNINIQGYTKNEIESTYIRPQDVTDLEGIETKSALDSQVHTWDHEFKLDTAYTFSGKVLTKESHIVTDSLYYVMDEKPKLMPTNIKRAYSKKDIENNYVLKANKTNLNNVGVTYERKEFNNKHVYSFSGDGVDEAKDIHQITKDVHYVGEIVPTNVPTLVTRAYTAKEVEDNYVSKLHKNNINGINAIKEVDPDSYILKETLKSNIYYQSEGGGNDLEVHKFSLKKDDIYLALANSQEDSTLRLSKFDLGDKKYINDNLNENIYVLDNTDPKLLKLSSLNHNDDKSYNIINEGKNTDILLTDEEILELDNKIRLFQKEKLNTPLDRYGKSNWWNASTGHWLSQEEGVKQFSYGFEGYSIETFISLVNASLPRGASISDKEIKYINNNHDKYNFRLWVGHQSASYNLSYGVLLNPDGTEWRGFKKTVQEKKYTTTTNFPFGAQTSQEQYAWSFWYNMQTQVFSLGVEVSKSTHPNKKEKSVAIRGIQIYIDPDYTRI